MAFPSPPPLSLGFLPLEVVLLRSNSGTAGYDVVEANAVGAGVATFIRGLEADEESPLGSM